MADIQCRVWQAEWELLSTNNITERKDKQQDPLDLLYQSYGAMQPSSSLPKEIPPYFKMASKGSFRGLFSKQAKRAKTPAPGPAPELTIATKTTDRPSNVGSRNEVLSTSETFLDEWGAYLSAVQRPTSIISQSPSQPAMPSESKKSLEVPDELEWQPPPLFRAYPQAIKHAYLQAPTLSYEAILRAHHQEQSIRRRQGIARSAETAYAYDPAPIRWEKGKLDQVHSGSSSNWSRKIYVLIKSGRILEYSAKGSHERVPEKSLHLTRSSVAFASDAIPGRPWVLQVSERGNGAETGLTESSSSVLPKLPFKTSPPRKAPGTLLLILDSAEEMESWMSAVRELIDGLSGECPKTEGQETDTRDAQNRRSSWHNAQNSCSSRKSNRVSKTPSTESSVLGSSEYDDHSRRFAGINITTAENRSSFRPSLDSRSISPTVMSEDQAQLDRLRDDDFRLSYTSLSTAASSISRGTSLASSPIKDDFFQLRSVVPFDLSAEPLMEGDKPATFQAKVTDGQSQTAATKIPRRLSRTRPSGSHPGPALRRAQTSVSTPRKENAVLRKHASMFSSQITRYPSNASSSDGVSKAYSERKPLLAEGASFSQGPDSRDPTEEISESIYKLLSSSPETNATPMPRPPRRSNSTPNRSRRLTGSSLRSFSMRPPPISALSGSEVSTVATYYPRPLRIDKRRSVPLLTSGPPPVPPPNRPLPDVPPSLLEQKQEQQEQREPLKPAPKNAPDQPLEQSVKKSSDQAATRRASSQSERSKELSVKQRRKQSWRVMRSYHPLLADVV